jgi:transposase
MSANGLYKNNSIFGAHLRRMKARMGPTEAITATAHKMARTIYFMMQRKTEFQDAGGNYYDKLNREKTLKFLKKRAESLGYCLKEAEDLSSSSPATCT